MVTKVKAIGGGAVNRWWQMVAAVIAMMAIANLQYAWTLFTTPLTQSLGATLAAVQVAFAAFVLAETWLVPFEGALVDHFGPRAIIMVGGVLVGLGWIGSGLTSSLGGLYFWYVVGGIGAGRLTSRRILAHTIEQSRDPIDKRGVIATPFGHVHDLARRYDPGQRLTGVNITEARSDVERL